MSIPVLAWTMNHSTERLGNRLVLLALAEHAHDDGTKAFPSNETLQRRTMLSERGVRDALRALENNDAIVQTGTHRSGARVYTVIGPFNGGQILPGAESAGGANFAARGAAAAPDPSRTSRSTSSSSNAREKSKGVGPKTVHGVEVTTDEHALTDEILAAFNEISGKRFAGADWRGKIIRRIREHPELTLHDHRTIIEHQFRRPWWQGEASPSVIYGNGAVFDRALNRVEGPATVDERFADIPDFSEVPE